MEIKSNKYQIFSFVFILIFLSIIFFYLGNVLVLLQENFFRSCPNKDFLTWDPSLRFIQTLQMMDNLRNFRFFHFLFQILDSPTWPVLRNLIQIPVFFLYGIDQIADIQITFAFLIILLFFSGYYLYKEISGKLKNWFFIILFFLVLVLIFQSYPILIYSFTGMLEIQGAVFFMFAIYSITLYYKENHKKSKWLVLFSTLLLFHTKYPYGYMLALSVITFQFLLNPKNFFLFVKKYFIYIFSSFRNMYRIIIAMVFLALYLLPIMSFPGKTKNYLKFFIFIFLSLDCILYIFKNKKTLLKDSFEKIVFLFQWILLPILLWVMIHPDRFSSSGSTIAHQQTEGVVIGQTIAKDFSYYTLFFREISTNVFQIPFIGWVIFLCTILSFLVGYYYYKKHSEFRSSFVLSFFILTPILFLTFLTSNHQARHIYHIIPAFVLCALLFFSEISKNLPKYIQIIFLIIAFSYALYSTNLVNSFVSSANLCFSGKDRQAYNLPIKVRNFLQSKSLPKQDTILINNINPLHVNRADVEFIFNLEGYKNKKNIITNPKNINKIDKFQEVDSIGNDCTEKEEMKNFRKISDKKYTITIIEKSFDEDYCLVRYNLQKLDATVN